VPADRKAIMHRATEDLRRSGILDRIVKVGAKMPAFKLANHDGGQVASDELLRSGPLVLSFFRGSWGPYCQHELDALQDVYSDIKALGASLIVISPERPGRLAAMAARLKLTFPILWDEKSRVAQSFGLAFTLPDELKQVYLGFGNDLAVANGDPSWRLPVPARFVVDRDGIVRSVQ